MVITLLTVTLSTFFIFSSFWSYKEFEKKGIEKQVSLIIKTHEQFRLVSEFQNIAKTIFNIDLVESVILLDSNCGELHKIPLSVSSIKNCSSFEAQDQMIFMKINDPFSSLNVIVLKYSSNVLSEFFAKLYYFIFVVGTSFLIILLIIYFTVKNYFRKPLENIIQSILELSNSKSSRFEVNIDNFPKEVFPIFRAISKTKKELISVRKKLISQAELETKRKIYRQVSHDIRSPLAALSIAIKDIDNLPESTRLIVRSSVQRIQDIANNLITKTSSETQSNPEKNVALLLQSSLEEILSEKRLQYRSKVKVHIEGNFHSGFGLFSNVNNTSLKRIISNLVNNSVEALHDGAGKISLTLRRENDFAIIEIQDNGTGIPSRVLA
ncbi:MAG: HAMP domain-containing histidine kinase, partial [Halobacteriovoraceae bacterium]|nr:HAMP domain-containing histidine kinase [Halobacteriovoraceae bacterium]